MDNDIIFNDTLQQEDNKFQSHTEVINIADARAEELRQSDVERALPKGFKFDQEGWLVFEEEKDGETSNSIKICSRLEVVARSRDQNNENHGRILSFKDPDGVMHRWAMPMALLAGDGTSFREELLSKGLLIAPGKGARSFLATYIQISNPPKTVRCVPQVGWNKSLNAFVLSNETIGEEGNKPLILQTSTGMSYSPDCLLGSLEGWKELASLSVGNSRLMFALCIAFAPPLLQLLGVEGGGIHFRGHSSSGKTTCLRVAASVWGGQDFLKTWRTTSNGLEGTSAMHNDCLLCLDEMGEISPQEIGNVAYMLANGRGKGRADKLGNARESKKWQLLFFSSGEIKLGDHMAEAKKTVRAGHEVRILEIPADGLKEGCFEDIHGFENGKAFADHLAKITKAHYGIVGREFLRHLVRSKEQALELWKMMNSSLTRRCLPKTASSQVQRAFNRFILIAVAGELATQFGLTGWEKGVATEAVVQCFNDWLRARGDVGLLEERHALDQIRHFFELHGESRFSACDQDENDKPQGKTLNRAGFRKSTDEGIEFYVLPGCFKSEICQSLDPEFVATVCIKNGWLIPDSKGGSTRSERLPGIKGTTRVYRFSSKVLQDEE